MEVCSFSCAKRYVQEVLTGQYGLRVKHGKVLFYRDVFGANTSNDLMCHLSDDILGEYRKLGLYCEKAGKTIPQHKDDIPPEAWREGKTKREECTFRVNISHPPELGIIYFTKVVSFHTHSLPSPSMQNVIGLTRLSPDDIIMVSDLAINGANRAFAMRVIKFAENN